MHSPTAEEKFFHEIAAKVRTFVVEASKDMSIAKHKREGDFSTVVDVGVEKLIVREIQQRFPEDQILAEEGHNDTEIPNGRIWIIDPICGTSNLARGIKNFCTNIALADNHNLIASCVIDHSQDDYFWSTGGGTICCNDKLFESQEERFDVVVDVDFGSVPKVENDRKEKHNRFLKKLVLETNYHLISLNSSLGFAYTATGKVDGFLLIDSYPWDICASSFLIQQAGGVITDLEGQSWTISSRGAVAAKDKKLYKTLLEMFQNA